MLTQKNILGPDVGVYHMHTWALPADLSPVVSNMQTRMRDGGDVYY